MDNLVNTPTVESFKEEAKKLLKKYNLLTEKSIGKVILHVGENFRISDVQLDIKVR